MKTQKTYLGRTAGGWLKKAEVTKMACGDYSVTHPDLPGCILMLSVDCELVISNFTGIVAALETSNRAYDKMQRMESEANKLTLEAAQ